jgi:hypothetical protein
MACWITGIRWQRGEPQASPQREQSVASRLERHPTPSAKIDGMSSLPAVNPGKPRLPGFLAFGAS